MNEIIEQHTTSQQVATNPFGRMLSASGGVNAGAVAIEQERAIAEAQGQIIIAKKFPRDLNAVYAEVMETCKLKAMAEVAFYTVPQGGQKVVGASIKLIEQIASSYQHMEWGHRELSRTEATADSFGRSEVEVIAWDKQKNVISKRQITVLHVLDTKDGPRRLRDQRDIDNRIANVASKQMRGRLKAVLPKWLIEAAEVECRKTLAGDNEEPVSVRVRNMTQAFAKYGVTIQHLEEYLQHSVDSTTLDELVDLTGVFNAIKDGAKASDYFSLPKDDEGAALTIAAKQRAAAAPTQQAQQEDKVQPATTKKTPATEKPRAQAAPQKEQPTAQPAQQEPPQQEAPPPETQQQGGDPDDVF